MSAADSPVERALAGEHLVENRAKRKNVGARVGGFSAHLLGRHVAHRAQHSSRFGGDLHGGRFVGQFGFRTRELGQTEVEDLGLSVIGDEQVLRLQVAMNNTFLVRRRQTPARSAAHNRSPCGKRAARSAGGRAAFHPPAVRRRHRARRGPRQCRKIERMLGWFSAAAARDSCAKRCRRSGSPENDAGRILMATSRFSRASRARYTSPIPPAPSGD